MDASTATSVAYVAEQIRVALSGRISPPYYVTYRGVLGALLGSGGALFLHRISFRPNVSLHTFGALGEGFGALLGALGGPWKPFWAPEGPFCARNVPGGTPLLLQGGD